MSETAPRYYAILTDAGMALEASALAQGRGIELTHIAVGDANKEYITPRPEATALAHEVWRKTIDSKSVSADDPNITLLHTVIPATDGGFWIRELGVIARLAPASPGGEPGQDVLYAYANHAPYYKMLPQDGQTVTHEIIVPITTSSNAQITIVVSDQGYATKTELAELAASLPGAPDFVELAANLVRVSDRVTRLELAREAGASFSPAGTRQIGPEGYRLGDAIIAPVTIVGKGAQVPKGAAYVVELFENESQ